MALKLLNRKYIRNLKTRPVFRTGELEVKINHKAYCSFT